MAPGPQRCVRGVLAGCHSPPSIKSATRPAGQELSPLPPAPSSRFFPAYAPAALHWPSRLYFSPNPEPQACTETTNKLLQVPPFRWASCPQGSVQVGTTGCPPRGRELEGTLQLHEFMGEAEELQSWLASQKLEAGPAESLGEDHAHILVRRAGAGRTPSGARLGAAAWPAGLWRRGPWESGALAEDRPSEEVCRHVAVPPVIAQTVRRRLQPHQRGAAPSPTPLFSSAPPHQVRKVPAPRGAGRPVGGSLPATGREPAGARAQGRPRCPAEATGPAVSAQWARLGVQVWGSERCRQLLGC